MSSIAAAELSERELREFLFRPGFSTASSTSELAGRGVGLDVVRANVHALNGEIEVRSETGRGACFTVKVPLTLIISQALFVRCGTSVFAFPLAVVEEIRRLRPEEIEDVGGKLLTRVRDVVTEVVRLDLAACAAAARTAERLLPHGDRESGRAARWASSSRKFSARTKSSSRIWAITCAA